MSTTIYKTSNVVTTELGRLNQLSAAVATGYIQRPTTTINYKRGVLKDETINQYPRIRYFGIGIRGYANITSENNIAQPFMPSPANMDLYEPIPFRCVPEPLSQEEAQKYRMVVKTTIGGKVYYQYWLKLLEFETDTPKLTEIKDNQESSYIFDNANLNPVPTDLIGTDVTTSDKIVTQVSLTAIRKITGAEVTEVINAMYGGDLRRARISELGLYTGVEKAGVSLSDSFTDNTVKYTYNEAAHVQLASHLCCVGYDLSNPETVVTERCVIENGSAIRV